mgnify:CR=1 FL=1|jgi:hypothetical protein
MAREKLPNRRLSITRVLQTDNDKYYVSFGVDPQDITPKEVFVKGSKIGSDMDMLLDDASVVLSLALQYGVPVDQLIHSLDTGREDGAKSVLARGIAMIGEEIENVRKEITSSGNPL